MKITDNDISKALQDQVKQAINNKQALSIFAGNSKRFFGNNFFDNSDEKDDKSADAIPLDLSNHTGVINYEPTELCITVHSGTKLSELENLLAENNQILAFEPPHYSVNNQDTATIGGAIASGISGPRRAYTGSARDSILGVEIINGHGEIARFGGEVMKNVAGYDLSRMMLRSLGTLGVLLNVSIRVIPKPEHNMTLVFDASQSEALAYFQSLRKKLLPVTATAWFDGKASIRLSASAQVLQSCQDKVKGDVISDTNIANKFWQDIRDHSHDFFSNDKPLWRFSLPPSTPEALSLDGEQLIEWSSAQRWIHSLTPANIIRDIAKSHKGYATLFNSKPCTNQSNLSDADVFPELAPELFALHKRLKDQMDPHGIFNPNRIYRGL
ncbi:MAG TPA: glycolate oxidase subunit GlcE [Leucothrix sp.]|nr:glycolate oxidase subunit GlcE [Leucothrix sp.]